MMRSPWSSSMQTTQGVTVVAHGGFEIHYHAAAQFLTHTHTFTTVRSNNVPA
jgi:hypothetical protein